MTKSLSGFLEFRSGEFVIIRIGQGTVKMGDSYSWAVTATIDGAKAEVIGVSTAPITSEAARCALRLLRAAGLKATGKRLKAGQLRSWKPKTLRKKEK